MNEKRQETDSMGVIEVDSQHYWGAQTERARLNFQVSPYRIPLSYLRNLCLYKGFAAQANAELGLIPSDIAQAIHQASREAQQGRFDQEFPLDVFQTGSGTSWNMNANEVLAARANEILTGSKGGKTPVHPNDHVNRGQSSNDVIPGVLNYTCRLEAEKYAQALDQLALVLTAKVKEFFKIIKIGRTHLQDAVPMTLGQEFSAWARQIQLNAQRLRNTFPNLEELALGGTALGTGINSPKDFAPKVILLLAQYSNIPFHQAQNLFEALSARDSQVELFGALNTSAVSLLKIGNDLRLLASGPRTGFAEVILPSLQPGSSIMPGKVNPVILEMLIQACAHVMGQNVAVTIAGQNSPLQLNMMMPLLAFETLSALELLTNTVNTLKDKCILGIQADAAQCRNQVERSLALVTPLALKIGYDKAAETAKEALQRGLTIRELVLQKGLLTTQEADEILNPESMV